MSIRELNKYQTPLTEELKESLHHEIWEELMDCIENIQFITNVTALEEVRGYVKDRPKDSKGRVIVDLTNPHILENMDYFRERAIFYEKNKCYTHLRPNPNPKSEYALFWKEELRKWKEGVTRPDGEWISGYYYFYLNYCPIWLNIISEDNSTKKKADRVRSFPRVWLGDYLFFHYLEQAISTGSHFKMLKTRGIGASFKFSGITPCNMYIKTGLPNFHLASDKTFLEGDKGVFGKIVDNLDWISNETPLPRMRLINRLSDMEIQLGYQDEYGRRRGLKSSVFGISLKDNPQKARGVRGPLIHYEEDGLFKNLETAWNVNRKAVEDGDNVFGILAAAGCVCAGTKVWTNDGRYINIEDLHEKDGILGFNIEDEAVAPQTISQINPPNKKECVEIKTTNRNLKCSLDHPILVRQERNFKTREIVGTRSDFNKKYNKTYINNRYKTETEYSKVWKNAGDIKVGDVILVVDGINIWGDKTLFDARLVGMLIGDGSYGMRRHYDKMEFKTPSFSNCDEELVNYVLTRYPCNIELQRPTKDGRLYHEISIRGLVQSLKDIGIAGQSKDKKRLPIEYMNLTKEDSALLIAGLFDTDGYIHLGKDQTPSSISITQSSEEMLKQIKVLLEKFGVFGSITKVEPRISPDRKDKNPYYRYTSHTKKSLRNFNKYIPLLIKYKQTALQKIEDKSYEKEIRVYNTFNNIVEERILEVTPIGEQFIYNLTARENNTYLANNIITHNTGGVSGADFEGSEKLFRNPQAYNIYGIPNVFDKNIKGTSLCGFFWGAYLNRANCYDSVNGEPDVVKALIEILKDRFLVKYSSADPSAITQKKAEECITPAEAVMQTSGTIFPVSDLKDYLDSIKAQGNAYFNSHYVGELITNSNNEIKWSPSDAFPLRQYRLHASDNKMGAVEIFEMPKKDSSGIISNRYIVSCDPYDDDTGTSLGSIFVFDTFNQCIVAEYTGRPKFADDLYEICRRLTIFYNAKCGYESNKKGLFTYFSQRNCLYLLAENPSILVDKELMKGNQIGNKAYGVHATAEINAWARRLIRDWLLKPASGVFQEYDDEGNQLTHKLNMHTIRSIPFLEELIAWNGDINTDRVSSMGICMILNEEYKKFNQVFTNKEQTKDFADNDYFNQYSKYSFSYGRTP